MRRQLTIAGLIALCASVATAQTPVIVLRAPNAMLEHEFSRIGSVRELANGSVLVTDVGDGVLVVADFGSGAVRTFGAKGAGPGEYRDLGRLIALRGDTTIMADGSNRRALLLFRDQVVATIPSDDPLIKVLGTDLIGADTVGRLCGLRSLPPKDFAATPRRDLIAVLCLNRATLQVDTLAMVRAVELHTQAIGTPPQQSFRTSTALMSSPEQAAVFPGGDLAVALQEPYRVDRYTASGAVRRGAPIERVPPPINDAEKVAWKKRYEDWSGKPAPAVFDRMPWAAVVPPFQQGGLSALPDGNLLVAREPWSGDSGNTFDVVDATGLRIGMLRLPAGSRVVGTGRGAVFVSVTDGDGIQRLHRHPW